LTAISSYRARASRAREYVKGLYKSYEQYLKPIEDVRDILAREMIEGENLSRDVVDLRRKEIY